METLHRLRILKMVNEAGSFSRAAAALHMSQPAVSQHITALEREMGVTLFERSPRGAQLTPAGHVVHRRALDMLRTARDTQRELALLDQGSPRVLRLAAFPSSCAALLPVAARLFKDGQPGADVELAELDAQNAIEAVKRGDSDMAIVFDYAARPLADPAVEFEHVLDDPLHVALPIGHPQSSAPVVDLLDLVEDEWIEGTAFGCGEVLHAICASAGFTPRVSMRSNRYPTTQALVAAGHGVALVPALAATPTHPAITIRLLRPTPPHRRIWAVTSRTSEVAPEIDAMLACLRAAAADRGPAGPALAPQAGRSAGR